MPNEGYRKRLEQWEAQQREIARQKESGDEYKPGAMKVRAPLGCLLLGAASCVAAVYFLVSSAGWWKRLFF